jgi:chromatin structure-remodeling complex subunit RSC1/2
MSDAANASIPLEVRQQFPCDDRGRVLWFTTPPQNNTLGPAEIVSPKDGKPLAHTPEYLAAKGKRSKLIEERKKQIQERMAAEQMTRAEQAANEDATNQIKRRKMTDAQLDNLILQSLTDQILNQNKQWYRSQYGDRAAEVEAFDAQRAAERRKEVQDKEAYFQERKKKEEERRESDRRIEGKLFRDDWDERH